VNKTNQIKEKKKEIFFVPLEHNLIHGKIVYIYILNLDSPLNLIRLNHRLENAVGRKHTLNLRHIYTDGFNSYS
jgi:hypothetical protein